MDTRGSFLSFYKNTDRKKKKKFRSSIFFFIICGVEKNKESAKSIGSLFDRHID